MKKLFCTIVSCILLIAVLTGCGASNMAKDEAQTPSASVGGRWTPEDNGAEAETGDRWTPDDSMAAEIGESFTNELESGGENLTAGFSVAAQSTEKIIYTGYATVETTEFDASVQQLYALLEAHGAYLESSDVTGVGYEADYYGYQTYRTASFAVRVPVESFLNLENGLSALGYVTNLRNAQENVTQQYFDTKTRLETYQAEAERLRKMMESAETVGEMIEIESRLSEVVYNIDSLTTTLNAIQKSVDYSTLYLDINEVKKISVQTPVTATYWEQMKEGFVDSIHGIGEFFADLLMWIVVALPVLAVILFIPVVTLIVVFSVQRKKKRRRKAAAAAAPAPAPEENSK